MGPLLVLTVASLCGSTPPGEPVDVGPLGHQRQVSVGERLPRILDILGTNAGVVVPLQAPFSIGQAVDLVQRLGEPALGEAEDRALRFNLRSFALITTNDVAWQLSAFGGPEVYGRSTEVDVGPAWEMGFRERQPVFGLDAQFAWHLFEEVSAWGRATFDLRQDQNLYTQPQPQPAQTNIMAPEAVDVSFPHRAFVGVGGASWGLHLGRDRLELGNGRMGNLLLGDSADTHDFARAQFFLPQFIWTSLVLRLDPTLLDAEALLPGMDALRSQQKHLVVHRAEVIVFQKLHLAVSEGWMIGGVPLDLRHLNPLLVFHNQFAWNEVGAYKSASILVTLEATLVPIRGVKLWGQYGINQLQSPWEQDWYPQAAGAIANANAFLAGIELTAPLPLYEPTVSSWVKPTGVVHLFGGAEFVETNPWFGLRENPLISWSSRRRVPSNLPGGAAVVEQPLGWRFGPDSRVLRLWAGGLDTGLGQVELGVEQRLQGEQTLHTPYAESEEAAALVTPTGTPEVARVVTVQLEVLPLRLERFSATIRLDWRVFFIDNARHSAGVSVVDDQLALGLRVDL